MLSCAEARVKCVWSLHWVSESDRAGEQGGAVGADGSLPGSAMLYQHVEKWRGEAKL